MKKLVKSLILALTIILGVSTTAHAGVKFNYSAPYDPMLKYRWVENYNGPVYTEKWTTLETINFDNGMYAHAVKDPYGNVVIIIDMISNYLFPSSLDFDWNYNQYYINGIGAKSTVYYSTSEFRQWMDYYNYINSYFHSFINKYADSGMNWVYLAADL